MYRGDGRLLCAGTARGSVHVVDISTRSTLRTFRGHRGPVHATHFGAPTELLTAGDDTSVRFWDMTSGAAVSILEHAHSDYVRCAHYGGAAAGTPHLWATGSYDHTVKLWDTRLLGRRGRAATESAAGTARMVSGSTLVARDDDADGGAQSDDDGGSHAEDGAAAAAAADRAADAGVADADGSDSGDASESDSKEEDDEGEDAEVEASDVEVADEGVNSLIDSTAASAPLNELDASNSSC